jgi:signal transduction histidine kinase
VTPSYHRVLPSSSSNPAPELAGKFLGEICPISSHLEILEDIFPVNHLLWLDCRQNPPSTVYRVSQAKFLEEHLISLTLNLYQVYQSSLQKEEFILLSTANSIFPNAIHNQFKNSQIQTGLLLLLNPTEENPVILAIYHSEINYCWSIKEIKTVKKVCYQALVAEQKNQELKRLRQNSHALTFQINQKLNANISAASFFKETLEMITKFFGFTQAFIIQTNRNKFVIIHQWIGEYEDLIDIKDREDWLGNQLADRLLQHTSQLFCTSENNNHTNILTLPIIVKEDFYGFLVLATESTELQLSEEELDNLVAVGQQIALGIYHEQNQEFLDETVHELRNPLVGILGFARVLQEQIYGELNEKQLQYINLIANSGEYLRDLVNDFLDLSRVGAEREELYLEKFAVEDLCLAALALVKERAAQQGLELCLEIGKNVDFFLADQRRLKQILVNLLSNAVKFTEIGSVTLKVEYQTYNLAFSVIDTGIGIAPEDQSKLFRPFGQIKKHPLARKQKGSGLGLALSRKLAQLHGGDITLISEVGKGTCLTVLIPGQEISSVKQF